MLKCLPHRRRLSRCGPLVPLVRLRWVLRGRVLCRMSPLLRHRETLIRLRVNHGLHLPLLSQYFPLLLAHLGMRMT